MSELRELREKYYELFGEPYMIFLPCNKTEEEMIKELKHCIKNKVHQKESDVEYDPDAVY